MTRMQGVAVGVITVTTRSIVMKCVKTFYLGMMKTIREAAREHIYKYFLEQTVMAPEISDAFKAGIEFAQTWISVEDELPEDDKTYLLKNKEWIDSVNPTGVGVGFYSSAQKCWFSAYWGVRDGYVEDYYPTHWRPIEIK